MSAWTRSIAAASRTPMRSSDCRRAARRARTSWRSPAKRAKSPCGAPSSPSNEYRTRQGACPNDREREMAATVIALEHSWTAATAPRPIARASRPSSRSVATSAAGAAVRFRRRASPAACAATRPAWRPHRAPTQRGRVAGSHARKAARLGGETASASMAAAPESTVGRSTLYSSRALDCAEADSLSPPTISPPPLC